MAKNDAGSNDEEIRDKATVPPDAEDSHADAGEDGESTLTREASDDGQQHGDGSSENHADGGPAGPVSPEADGAIDLVSKAKGSIDGLFSHLRRGWEEYTEDVRQPEPPVRSEPAAGEHAATATVAKPAVTVDGEVRQAVPANVAAAPTAVQLPHPSNVARGAASVVKSFVDGVLGRPQPPVSGVAGGGKRSSLKTALKIVTGIFAVLGVLAVFRASMDAFRPRR